MIITRLKLTNWKNFKSLDVRLRERVFVVGANASGKSNILDAFRFLRDIAKPNGGGLQTAVTSRGGISKIRSLAARKNPLVELEVELSAPKQRTPSYRYGLGIRQENKGKRRILLAYERVWKGQTLILDRPDTVPEDQDDDERLTRTFLENPNTNSLFREINDLFKDVAYLHLVPQLLRSVKSTDIEQAGEDFYGRNFLVRISKTREADKTARLKKIFEALSKALPQFDDMKEEKDDAGMPHLLLRLKHWRPDAGWQNEEQFSDGTIRMLGLFWSMLEGDSVLLYEEPELSLNDLIVEQLPNLLWKLQASKGRQTIITTHSYALLSDRGIGCEEVIVLEPGKEGTIARNADTIKEVVSLVKGGMNIGQAVLPLASPPNMTEPLL